MIDTGQADEPLTVSRSREAAAASAACRSGGCGRHAVRTRAVVWAAGQLS
jgi:hypothetical protein